MSEREFDSVRKDRKPYFRHRQLVAARRIVERAVKYLIHSHGPAAAIAKLSVHRSAALALRGGLDG